MRKTLIISFFLVVLALLFMLFGFNVGEHESLSVSNPVILMVENDTGAFLMQLKQGAQKAAAELNSELAVEIVTHATLDTLLQRWTPANTAGILLYIEDDSLRTAALDALTRKNHTTAVLAHASDGHTSVIADAPQSGELAGNYARNYETVFLIGDDGPEKRGALRALSGCKVITQGLTPQATNACVIALNAELTKALAKEKAEGLWAYPLIGYSAGEEQQALLESGLVDAMIFEAPYAMGYEAVHALKKPQASYAVPCRLVTKGEMYDAQNVKLVFPLLY